MRLLLGAQLLCLAFLWSSLGEAAKCVQVFFDDPAHDSAGEINAIFLQNLIGHFPSWKVVRVPIDRYIRGQVNSCAVGFYIGNVYNNPVPKDLVDDLMTSSTRFAWLGYNIWQLDEVTQKKIFGIHFKTLTTLDDKHFDKSGRPTFFKFIDYKGVTFVKYGEYESAEKSQFNSDFELLAVNTVGAKSLAMARHGFDQRSTPYATVLGHHYFFADVPFSYITEEDRYLVFADILFDILNEKPRRSSGLAPAVFRLEDVHSHISPDLVRRVLKIAKEEGVVAHMAVVPVFTDPTGYFGKPAFTGRETISDNSAFMQLLQEQTKLGVRLITHGTTHQLDDIKNPTGIVANDFEFWDTVHDAPVPMDSVSWTLTRLNEGWNSIANAGLKSVIWEAPHYHASTLDYLLFSRVFPKSIGRVVYQSSSWSGMPESSLNLRFSAPHPASLQNKVAAFATLQTKVTNPLEDGQFFPYEIDRDFFGQSIIPENLGNPSAMAGGRTLADIRSDAKRNRVLRDRWASFFYHAFLLERPDGEAELRRTFREIKAMGYQFVDLENFH
jgi:uncharacterized protein YdaL